MDDRRKSFDALEAAEKLAPVIRAAQEEIEGGSELPASLASKMAADGMFRLLLPKDFGGSEVSLPEFIRVVQIIGASDGSAGWLVSQGSVFGSMADYMDPEAAAEIWGADPNSAVATGAPIQTDATRTDDDGFLVSGHWRFASGCGHVNWMAANCNLTGRDGNAEEGRFFLMPRDEVPITDAWNVRGMKGTGSHDYYLDKHRIPGHRYILRSDWGAAPGRSTGLPTALLFACGFGSVGLGLARRALDSLVELAEGKIPIFKAQKLRDDEQVQSEFAEAEALYQSTRAFLMDMAEDCAWHHEKGDAIPNQLRARLRLAATNAMRQSAEVINHAYSLAGTDAIFDNHPIHRCFQDIHALTQQIQGRKSHYRTVGRVLLGLDADTPFV